MGIFDVFSRPKKARFSELVDEKYKDLLTEAHERWLAASESDEAQREEELDDLRFCRTGNQWPEDVRRQREAEGRPCLEVDRVNSFVRNVCNELRQMRPQPMVNPVGDGASKETAEILQGMIRHIAYRSNGDTAIDTATESMVRCGRGYFRVLTEYVDSLSFEQDISIKRIPNPHMVYLDPSASEPDGSDANWAFIAVDMTREAYKREYPSSKMAELSQSDLESVGDDVPEWAQRDGAGCRVMEYFKRVRVPVTLVRLSDGSIVKKSEIPEGAIVEDERESFEEKVLWFKLNAVEVLEKTEWPGKYIPIIPVYGTELCVDGKRTWSGLVRVAKDPQRHFNYMKSRQAEAIALVPLTPIIAPKGSLGTAENRNAWKNANKKTVGVLEYEAFDTRGNALPSPQRMSSEVNIGAITQAILGSVDDLKATTGMYDASMGNREANQSGIAIRQLQKQGQVGNYHYQDNAARSVRHLGRVLIDLIPKIYDTQRMVRIIKPDETTELVTINGPSGQRDKETGMERVFDVQRGKYDVTVSVGPSYQSKRQEMQALMDSMAQGPFGEMLRTVAPDFVLSFFDGIDPKIIERVKKAIPPKFQDEPDKAPQIPPQVQQQMQAMGQQMEQAMGMVQQLSQALNAAQDKLDNKRLELESRERIAALQAKAELVKVVAQQEGQAGMAVLQSELQEIQNRLALLNSNVPIPPESEPVEAAGPEQPEEFETAGGIPPEGVGAP